LEEENKQPPFMIVVLHEENNLMEARLTHSRLVKKKKREVLRKVETKIKELHQQAYEM
jgi:hypothetical protein